MEYENAVTKLTNNPNIAMQKAEKIKKFVILDEEFYFEQLVKCNHSDSIIYVKIDSSSDKNHVFKIKWHHRQTHRMLEVSDYLLKSLLVSFKSHYLRNLQ